MVYSTHFNLQFFLLTSRVPQIIYTPISVTNYFGKILEKIIYKNLHNYINDCNILTNNQSGFRSKESTINQLLNIYDTIMKKLNIYI